MTAHPFSTRQQAVQSQLDKSSWLLLSQPTDIAYLTGFEFLVPAEREAFLLINQAECVLFHAGFSPVPHPATCAYHSGCSISDVTAYISKTAQTQVKTDLQIHEDDLRVAEFKLLQNHNYSLTAVPPQLLANLRKNKSSSEIERIETACQVTADVVGEIINSLPKTPQIWIGKTEKEIAQEITLQFMKRGCAQQAFPTIVAFGENSAVPHHQPTNRRLRAEEVVLIDCGAKFENYCADMTRTTWFGTNPPAEYLKIERVVQGAYSAACHQLQTISDTTLISPAQVDAAARDFISLANYGPNFIHTTGHGLGLDIHEFPSVSYRSSQPLSPNMVITVEPGIYLPGKFGYRHENTWLVLESGARSLMNEA